MLDAKVGVQGWEVTSNTGNEAPGQNLSGKMISTQDLLLEAPNY